MKTIIVIFFSIISLSIFSQVLPDSGFGLINQETISNEIKDSNSNALSDETQIIQNNSAEYIFKRSITDLQPIPNKGDFYLNTFFQFEYLNVNTYENQYISSNANSIFLDLTTGITNNLSVGIISGYLLSNKIEIDSYTEVNSKGIFDPTFQTTFRFLDLNKNPFDVDINLYYTPNLKESKSPTESTNGNARNNANSYSAKLSIGRRIENRSWAYSISIYNQEKGQFFNAETNKKTITKSWQAVSIGADFLYKTNSPTSYRLGFKIKRTGAKNYLPEDKDGYAVGIDHDFSFDVQGYHQITKSTYLTIGSKLLYGTNEDYDYFLINLILGTMVSF